MPATFRKVSCWPANEASGRSSAVAEERTAKEPLPSASSLAKAPRMAFSNSGEKGASTTHWRICAPTVASSRTSSGLSVARRSAMRLSRPEALRKSRNASAVVAKPPGTRTPAPDSWLIISPSDAFLPPTESTSVMRSCSNETTYDIEVTFYNGKKASLVSAPGAVKPPRKLRWPNRPCDAAVAARIATIAASVVTVECLPVKRRLYPFTPG